MNMIAKQAEIKKHCIQNLNQTTEYYPDYPEKRYIIPLETDNYNIPEGPWDTESNKRPSEPETLSLQARMCRIDSFGRPLHPWFEDLAHTIGVVAGRGKYWNWGPNYTVDPVVIAGINNYPKLLMVKRLDNGKWALPGGFLDYISESTINASVRECREETGVIINELPLQTIYTGPVADERTTAHAWAYTNAKLWILEKTQPIKPQIEEVQDVQWIDIANLPINIHGSHAKIIEFALLEIFQ